MFNLGATCEYLWDQDALRKREKFTLLPSESLWQADWGIPFQSVLDEANQNLYDTVRNIPTGFWKRKRRWR